MFKRALPVMMAILYCTQMLAGCIKKGGPVFIPGGVYSSGFDELDLDIEISKRSDCQQALSQSQGGEMIYSWGLRRRPGQLPDADPGAPQMLKKYGGLYHGDTSQKTIYLTFDEGYENGYTTLILNTLRKNRVKAAFFITGPYLKEHEDLVRRMVEEGHTVGNHTVHHPSLPQLDSSQIEEEILGLDRVFYEKFDKHMRFLRPPKGEYSERSLQVTSRLGYVNLFWSFAYDDWHRDKSRGSDYAYRIVMENLHNGAVLLLHAVSRDNAHALEQIIRSSRQKGYEFGDVYELAKK